MRLVVLSVILFILTIFFHLSPPEGLTVQSWHLLIIFFATICGAISLSSYLGPLISISLLAIVATETLPTTKVLEAFQSKIVWLVLFSFFISRAVIESQLGKRIAYFLIEKCGGSVLGLSYAILLAELFLTPIIPAATARAYGVIYPVVRSITAQYEKMSFKSTDNIRKFLMNLCAHSNIVTCSMLLTAVAGNALMARMAADIGVNLSLEVWAKCAFIPGLCILIFLPLVIIALLKPKFNKNVKSSIEVRRILNEMGTISPKEVAILATFAFLVILWTVADFLNTDVTPAALLVFVVLLLMDVISWRAIRQKEAWDITLWFAGFIMFSQALSETGAMHWLSVQISTRIQGHSPTVVLSSTVLLFFYAHYLFASVIAYASSMYLTFALMMISVGCSPLLSCMVLAVLANLSSCLTHYGCSATPIFFTASTCSISEWWKIGFVVGLLHLTIWSTVGISWLKFIKVW